MPVCDTSARSEHSATYLTRSELNRASRMMAIQKSRSEGADVFGEQLEQVLAEIMGGTWFRKRTNRPVPDFWDQDGVPYSSKTLLLEPVASRPDWRDRLGETVSLPVSRIKPTGELPKGKTLFDASARAIGQRVVEAYNASLERYGVERLAVTLRLRVDEEQLWRYLYWEEDLKPIDPAQLKWTDSKNGEDGWSRNLRAIYRGAAANGPAALRWTSSGSQLWIRHQIPTDADTFIVPDDHVLDRERGNAAISREIDEQLGI